MAKNFIVQTTDEVYDLLKQGKKVPGLMFADLEDEVVKFGAFGRSNKRKKDLLIKTLEHGWVKESPARIKVFNSLPKGLGTKRIISVLERETKVVAETLIDREIIENV